MRTRLSAALVETVSFDVEVTDARVVGSAYEDVVRVGAVEQQFRIQNAIYSILNL